ncbi:HD domain-containing protein [Streptomyces sp. NPDC087901]|uniref:HD domain-containing protein n=1 Tax=unclassified Streptomyces TaxID=2593676 RepID=UPI0034218E52
MALDSRLWGKAAGLGTGARGAGHTHPLICHLLDTAAVAEVVWDELLTAHQRSMVAAASFGSFETPCSPRERR